MNIIVKFFHELRHPHCQECVADTLLNPVIEELTTELAHVRHERDQLLKYILGGSKSVVSTESVQDSPDEPQPILPKIIPWHVRRQMLEEEDRKKAQIIRESKDEQAKAIAELEKNLGIMSTTSLDLENGNVQSEPVKVNE